jgi:catechol 2,3-dioxygenase-like lactoylglutathione lyase family enzyme
MQQLAKSIRPFIGATDYNISRSFYRDLGFEEIEISSNMCLFKIENQGFYLQKAYVKDWIDNTMVFLEINNLEAYYQQILALNLPAKYPGVVLKPIITLDWGREFFLHDPSGILWHLGEFR